MKSTPRSVHMEAESGGVCVWGVLTNSISQHSWQLRGHVTRSWPMTRGQKRYITFLDLAPETFLTTTSSLTLFLCL